MRLALAAVTFSLLAPMAHADAVQDGMVAFVRQDIQPWLADPAVQSAIKAANDAHAALGPDEIKALDDKWRGEVGHAETPTISPVLSAPISNALRDHKAASGGKIVEIILMDNKGLNVAASDVTSDYWQGDEPKWQKTFAAGPNAIDVSDVELDESTQVYEGQVSIPVNDPATGMPIGAVTVGLNAEAF